MSRTIWKYTIPLADHFSLPMRAGSTIISVQNRGDELNLWAVLDKEAPPVTRNFAWYGTGWDLEQEDLGTHVCTVQTLEGFFVWHLFDLGETE